MFSSFPPGFSSSCLSTTFLSTENNTHFFCWNIHSLTLSELWRVWGRKEPLPITIFITWGKWLTIYQLFLSFFHFFFPFYFKFLFTFLFCLIICKTKTGGRELVMARRHISICRHNNNKKKKHFLSLDISTMIFYFFLLFQLLFSLFEGFHVT